VTNSLPVADALHHAPDASGPSALEVILTGGVRTPSDALVGPVADATIERLRVDRVFLGVHGLDPHGATTPNLLEAATDQALVASAARLTVLADHTKWGVVGLARIASLNQIDLLLSDDGLPTEARAVLEDTVGHVRLATTTSPPTPEDH
jgi:DeoR/GlpR family transcriptional regulator of sugar metabolism